jgi:hypothetical protein
MSSLPKGESMCTKLVELFANRVVERRNKINDYLRGRTCIESVRGVDFRGSVHFELFLWFWTFLTLLSLSWLFLVILLALPLFMSFVDFYDFPSSRWPSWAFLGFLGLLAVLHRVLDSNFKLCAFIVNGLKGEIEKASGQFLGLIVMSHWLGEVWIRIWDSFVLFFFYFCFVWRIVFSYLMVCRWQMWHGMQQRWSW